MALSEQTAAPRVGLDVRGAPMQISTLTAIEADLRRALSTDVPPGTPVPGVGVGSREDGRAHT